MKLNDIYLYQLSINLQYQMQSSNSSQQLQLTKHRKKSYEQLKSSPKQEEPQSSPSNAIFSLKKANIIPYLLVSVSILLLIFLFRKGDSKPKLQQIPILSTGDFDFYVYCPYYYHDKIKRFTDKPQGNFDLRRLQPNSYRIQLDSLSSNYDQNTTYVVEINVILDGSSSQLVYCGLATLFNSNCDQKVQEVCTSPGPIFDLKVGQAVDVVWINSLNSSLAPSGDCMDSGCDLNAKLYGTQTFIDPTNQSDNNVIPITIKPDSWPTSTHVHGAEVRPTFDGNPLSWINNNGSRGVGAFSSGDQCYYSAFDQIDLQRNSYLPPKITVLKGGNNNTLTKTNRYPNNQNPGNLWYHDHAMKLTNFNVQHGLSGNYILRDDKVQKAIGVDRSNQKIIMMTKSGWKTSHNLTLSSDTVYRFRFLNNNYDSFTVTKVSFVNGADCGAAQKIPFTIIGADSSLFHEGIQQQKQFTVAQAERMEILILFSANISVYSICGSTSSVKKVSLNFNFQNNLIISSLQNKKPNLNKRTNIKNVILDVPFVDFTDKDSIVVVKRMRPLIEVGSTLTINGRKSFHMGKSQNPTIGTYEDWFLINTMAYTDHPIHIHLINFQVIKVLSLRTIGPSLYELDFMVQAILKGSKFMNDTSIFLDLNDRRNINYTALSSMSDSIYSSQGFQDLLAQVNVQNQIDSQNISGINVEKKLDQYDRDLFKKLNITIPQGQDFKYITNQANQIKPYYKRWKDTALVQGSKVFVFRIRWAKSAYIDGSKDSYFHVPIDQLREYPGFVYHCHILDHQDNEMMRPIMLQLPKDVKLNKSTPCNDGPDFSWTTKVSCLNKRCNVPQK